MRSDLSLSEEFNVTSKTWPNLELKCSTLTSGVPRVFARAVRIIGDTYIRSRYLDLESNTEFSEQKNVCLDDVICFSLILRIMQSSKLSMEYRSIMSHLKFTNQNCNLESHRRCFYKSNKNVPLTLIDTNYFINDFQ